MKKLAIGLALAGLALAWVGNTTDHALAGPARIGSWLAGVGLVVSGVLVLLRRA